ncbi:hypothetical protein ACU4GR_07495 [Methylobacterium oryzae CBMB20]
MIPFSRGRYNEQATVSENLLFGVPRDRTLTRSRTAWPASRRCSGRRSRR